MRSAPTLSLEMGSRLGFGAAVIDFAGCSSACSASAFERFMLRRFYTADPILSLLVTFSLALVAEQAIRMIWGAAPLPSTMPPEFKGNVMVGEFLFSRYRLLLLAVVFVVMSALWLLLHKTAFGRVVRAGVQRPDMVAVLGIRLAAVHDGDRRARCRHRGVGRRVVRPDHHRASGDGHRDHDRLRSSSS